ncbi:TetR family transcriptional regulator [Paenarthrobacter sp. Z7-10]|uniref:TetR family transcriptional regulator n=1 Tax=Paenarthrobacter sp. Z7-10 TaxID=2787635 RepID=UPI0022A93EB4|nr:TetR family transcriptional regulator [Paenarthrobacter sp. Z7-10]MCZ2402126.1 TetR family transcriptional regulator [Paenarthrobacter sp. Z7-10]
MGSEELSSQARIRNAAVRHFATEGFGKANLRAIAGTAGVSAGLLIHHFGSKEGLRRACDEHVLAAVVAQARSESSPEGLPGAVADFLSGPEKLQLMMRYLGRAIAEDTAAGRTFVDTLTTETESILRAGVADGSVRRLEDPRAVSVLIVMTSLAVLAMPQHFTRGLGHDELTSELMRRIALPSLELYTYGLYTDDRFLQAARAALDAAATGETGAAVRTAEGAQE